MAAGAERSRRRAPQRATLLLTVGAALLTSTTPASAWLWAPSSGATRALSGPRGPATVRPVPDKSNEGGLVADKGQLQGRDHRKLMEEQASMGSNMACKLYFEGLGRRHDGSQHRNVQVAGRPANNHDQRSITEHNEKTASIHPSVSAVRNNVVPYILSSRRAGAVQSIIAERECDVRASVSATLALMGVANRVDFTVHEGLRYMDVVVEANRRDSARKLGLGAGDLVMQILRNIDVLVEGRDDDRECTGKRGLVVQILPQNARASYVSAKTAALQEDTWAVLTVKPADWVNKDTVQRTGWLARKLVKCGFWRETCQLTL